MVAADDEPPTEAPAVEEVVSEQVEEAQDADDDSGPDVVSFVQPSTNHAHLGTAETSPTVMGVMGKGKLIHKKKIKQMLAGAGFATGLLVSVTSAVHLLHSMVWLPAPRTHQRQAFT
jgi:hypothetical protein